MEARPGYGTEAKGLNTARVSTRAPSRVRLSSHLARDDIARHTRRLRPAAPGKRRSGNPPKGDRCGTAMALGAGLT